MATEASPQNIVDAPATEESGPTLSATASQNASSHQLFATEPAKDDGFATPNPEVADIVLGSADVSVNGGSDSEAIKLKSVADGHVRSSSTVKKPISFKAVSVNKTFLAAKGAANAIPAKMGDKIASGSTPPPIASSASTATRPRLVAKSGNGSVSASRSSGIGFSGKAGAAPDANAVWNKNRPAPVPEPKRVTDEELAEKYGIHLATRLQSDDPGRQANWADIDDDDDDWAPQSIEWSDGTKITMPKQAESPMPEPAQPVAPVVITRDQTPPPGPTMSSSMKLGGTGRGLVLKGLSEKPTLVAKPPAPPTPVKSPWAPLPPVDKVAPVVAELPQQQQTPRFSTKDAHTFDSMPPLPAKEIAADDFSRSWRDSHAGASKELYNSQSGRYEPVNDARISSRNNGQPRQPALLQRNHETQGPAEPSAAFQTHRANVQDSSYGRRRTSSNVSGGSGNFARRLSKGQESYVSHDMPGARRASLVAVEEPVPRLHSPSGHTSQRIYSQQQWQSRTSPAVSHASPASIQSHIAQPSTPAFPLEDEVELQKRIMRESRELARKRRLEEEAREDAERKERIRLKLEAMGPPPDTKKPKKETPDEDKAVPTQIQTRETSASKAGPPRPPIVDQAGEVKQYGMMKVHHPETVKSAVGHDPSKVHIGDGGTDDAGLLAGICKQEASQEIPQAPPTQLWQNNNTPEPDTGFPTWTGPAPAQTQGRNVWGPPTNDRTLGNGTFIPELSMPSSQMAQAGPGPIAPPHNAKANSPYQGRSREQYAQRPAPIGPPSKQHEHRLVGPSSWTSGNISDKPADIDVASPGQHERTQTSHSTDAPLTNKDAWRQAHSTNEGHRGESARHSLIRTPSSGLAPTWTDYPVRPRQDEAMHYTNMEQPPGVQHNWSQGLNNESVSTSALLPSRGSRFFPKSTDTARDDRTGEKIPTRPGSPSPPPPTMVGHPAYDGDAARPNVSLPRPPPIVKLPPAPVLAPIAPPKPASFAAAAAAAASLPPDQRFGLPLQPREVGAISQQTSAKPQGSTVGVWQDRINSLMGRKASLKSQALAVNSSSKNALDHAVSRSFATVSLPGVSAATEGEALYETKPMAEECFEEQEMGFVPVVKVPRETPRNGWDLFASQSKPLPRRFVVSDITGATSIKFHAETTKEGAIFFVRFPGMDIEKPIKVLHKVEHRQRSNPRRNGQTRGNSQRNASAAHSRGAKGRDTPYMYAGAAGEQASPSSSPGASTHRGGRGRGGFGVSWNQRHVSTPPNAINV